MVDFIVLPLIVAFLITTLSLPPTIRFAKKFKLVDDPTQRPHPAHAQQRVIPRAGGLAIYIGIVSALVVLLPLEKHLIGIILGITTLLAMGLIDDKLIYFNPYYRLGLLFLAAMIAVASGIGISFISNPLAGLSFLPNGWTLLYLRFDQFVVPVNFFGSHNIVLLADIFAFLLIVSLTQIINWSKGVDGQMPGITLITALTLGFLSLKLGFEGDLNQFNLAKISFIVAGTSLAFLIFNWHPAKILPGFSGSTILAFMLATLAILSGAKVATLFLVLAVPTIDFLYTFFRRISKGRSPVWGDRGHLHHRLLDLGWTHPQISLFYIAVSAILGSVALIVNTQSKFFGTIVVGTVFILSVLLLNSFRSRKKDIDE